MHLKKIELLGFKSFPNKTTVKFAEGLTAIVGPNGCGKTNILDSLRWVLGEQRPTLLRGGKMDEVIFNGTSSLKPLGMAEVMLTVVNDRGILPTEYHEITVGRRLFRSGESEYLINKVPCRLKDIIDLFADTGMGAHSYSVIQQDMIDAVISDKAEERRFLFEEASGITKYKQRRKAAQRKLEATENDFLRLKDIYAEVRTRVNSLYRQHKKAERYKKLIDEIRAWELYIGQNKYRTLQQKKRELRSTFDELSDGRTQNNTQLDQAQGQLESQRSELIGLEQQLSELSSRLYELTERAHDVERQISVLKEKRTNANVLIERNTNENTQLESRLNSLASQRDDLKSRLQEEQSARQRVAQELEQAETRQHECDAALLDARRKREEENKRLLELEGQLSSGKAEKDSLAGMAVEIQETITQIEAQLEASRPRQREVLSTIEGLRAAVDDLNSQKHASEKQKRALLEEMEQLVETGQELTHDISSLTAAVEAAQARKTLLEEMMVQYEGYESSVPAVMDNREQWPGLRGTVADLFVPAEGMERVVEAAIGELARFIICKDRATAEAIISYLRQSEQGRIGILVPDSGTITPAVKRPEITTSGVLGWLDDFVTTNEELRPLMQAVLARTIVFDAAESPDAILEQLPYGFSAISSEGILYRKNMVSGGSDDRYPLFRRKEKVAEQAELIEELSGQIDAKKTQKSQVDARLAAVRAESGQLESRLEGLEEQLGTETEKLNEAQFENRSFIAELERLEKERQQHKSRLSQIQDRQYSLGFDFDKLATQKETLVTDMSESGSRLQQMETDATRAAERVAGLQVSLIEARSRAEQTESQLGHIEDIDQELSNKLRTNREEIEAARHDITTGDTSLEELEKELKVRLEERGQQEVKQRELRTVQAEINERVNGQEAEVKKLRRERDDVSEQLHRQELQLTAMSTEMDSLVQRIREEYEVEIASIEAPYPDPDVTEDQSGEHLNGLREKLSKFGAVNMLALEEYEVASEREKFLSEQLADLTAAKNDLSTTISKINATARQLFNETLSKVQENFSSLFVELFNGGEATIRLADETDPLESDIEIIVRPRGKKLLPITMLSGGERALTAISLLFSLYLVKPSPFCILDEIDAPLDDANCHRFLRIIRKFSNQTQFITITHNKITMEAADNLYGITMEQPGVSTLVAVRFSGEDTHELDIEREPEATEVPAAVQERLTPQVNVNPEEDS